MPKKELASAGALNGVGINSSASLVLALGGLLVGAFGACGCRKGGGARSRDIEDGKKDGKTLPLHRKAVERDSVDSGLVVVLEGKTHIVDRANDNRVLRTSGPSEFNVPLAASS